jgi:hypothetical protein
MAMSFIARPRIERRKARKVTTVMAALFASAPAIAQTEPFVEEQAPELPGALSHSLRQIGLQGQTLLISDPSVNGAEGAFHSLSRIADRWVYGTTVTASDAAPNLAFGTSLALDGDTALVGAPGTGTNGITQIPGSAYVLVRSGTAWVEQQELVAPDGANDDDFGESVALSGDIAVVGAPGKPFAPRLWQRRRHRRKHRDRVCVMGRSTWFWQPGSRLRLHPRGSELHAARENLDHVLGQLVFTRSGTTWTERQELRPAMRATNFGIFPALSGNHAVIASMDSIYSFVRPAASDDAGSGIIDAGSPQGGDAAADAAPATGGPPEAAGDSGSCGCRIGSRSDRSSAVLVLIAACSALGRRRRRRC